MAHLQLAISLHAYTAGEVAVIWTCDGIWHGHACTRGLNFVIELTKFEDGTVFY